MPKKEVWFKVWPYGDPRQKHAMWTTDLLYGLTSMSKVHPAEQSFKVSITVPGYRARYIDTFGRL